MHAQGFEKCHKFIKNSSGRKDGKSIHYGDKLSPVGKGSETRPKALNWLRRIRASEAYQALH